MKQKKRGMRDIAQEKRVYGIEDTNRLLNLSLQLVFALSRIEKERETN